MFYNKAYDKLLGMDVERVKVADDWLFVIPEDVFSSEEIEDIRKADDFFIEYNEHPIIANFLPDGERPYWIKKY